MAMSGAVSVTTSPTAIISPVPGTRLVVIANQGAVTVFLKLDSSATVLTAVNGHPLGAGQTLTLGMGGSELPSNITGIVASGTCNVTAQTAPY